MRSELIAIALVASAAGGCKCKSAEPEQAPGGAPKGGGALIDKPSYRIDVGPGTPCKAKDPCTARIVLTALGDYHVNEQYPTKLVADPNPALDLGTATFTLDSAKAGTLSIPFRAGKPGTYKVTGTFKLCVCTTKDCEIEEPKISFDVTVS